MKYVEHAFNHSKYNEASEAPVLEITIPSINDATLAPEGHHVMSVNVAFMPYALEGGWQDAGIDHRLQGHLADRPVCAEPDVAHRGPRVPVAGRHRGTVRSDGRSLAPRRADDSPVIHDAPGLWCRAVRHTGQLACSCAAPAAIRGAVSPVCPGATRRSECSRSGGRNADRPPTLSPAAAARTPFHERIVALSTTEEWMTWNTVQGATGRRQVLDRVLCRAQRLRGHGPDTHGEVPDHRVRTPYAYVDRLVTRDLSKLQAGPRHLRRMV